MKEAQTNTSKTPKPKMLGENLKIERYRLSDLISIMPVVKMGRFSDVKLHIKREIAKTPAGQAFAVAAAGPLATNEKERAAFMAAIGGMFSKTGANEWTIKYTTVSNQFIVVRKTDWNALKQKKAAV